MTFKLSTKNTGTRNLCQKSSVKTDVSLLGIAFSTSLGALLSQKMRVFSPLWLTDCWNLAKINYDLVKVFTPSRPRNFAFILTKRSMKRIENQSHSHQMSKLVPGSPDHKCTRPDLFRLHVSIPVDKQLEMKTKCLFLLFLFFLLVILLINLLKSHVTPDHPGKQEHCPNGTMTSKKQSSPYLSIGHSINHAKLSFFLFTNRIFRAIPFPLNIPWYPASHSDFFGSTHCPLPHWGEQIAQVKIRIQLFIRNFSLWLILQLLDCIEFLDR